MNTSLCTRVTPGSRLPSSAISEKPAGATPLVGPLVGATPVGEPTIAGTCMRRPALTRRTNTLPVIPVVTGTGTPEPFTVVPAVALNNEPAAFVLLNATP